MWALEGIASCPSQAHECSPHVTAAKQGAGIGDVYVSTGKMHHDRRIPLPGFDKQVGGGGGVWLQLVRE